MTAKRWAVLVAMLTLALAAVPAMAQEQQEAQPSDEEISVMGVVERLPGSGGPIPYGVTDEASGASYFLDRGEGDYSAYEGQRVIMTGVAETDPNTGFNSLHVGEVVPAEDAPRADAAGEFTVNFELAVEGGIPEGTTFFAGASQQTVGLEDPDGDGTYEGALTLAADFAEFPVPVAILAGTPENPTQEIKSFGEVMLEDGDIFSVGYSSEGGAGTTPAGGTVVDEGTTGTGETVTDSAEAQYEDGGGTAEAAGIDLNEDGVVSEADGEFATQTSREGVASTPEESALPATSAGVLPSTGGLVLPVAGLAGALVLGGGLLIRRK